MLSSSYLPFVRTSPGTRTQRSSWTCAELHSLLGFTACCVSRGATSRTLELSACCEFDARSKSRLDLPSLHALSITFLTFESNQSTAKFSLSARSTWPYLKNQGRVLFALRPLHPLHPGLAYSSPIASKPSFFAGTVTDSSRLGLICAPRLQRI